MYTPTDPSTGRGVTLFALLMLALGLLTGLTRGAWLDAALWLALGLFLGCYGLITLDRWPRYRRVLLALGLLSGVLAFGLALWRWL